MKKKRRAIHAYPLIFAQPSELRLLYSRIGCRFVDYSSAFSFNDPHSIEFRFRERLRHDEGGGAITASDVRDTSPGCQFLLNTVKRGYPKAPAPVKIHLASKANQGSFSTGQVSPATCRS